MIKENLDNQKYSIMIKYSKSFEKIYKQALIAENLGLSEICGPAYRKAFEYLIKEYLIKKNPKSEHEKIIVSKVYDCINKYFSDEKIKSIAKRTLWLGNDHTHYNQKWKNKNLIDLKYLIYLTVEWIILTEKLSEVEKSMPRLYKKSD